MICSTAFQRTMENGMEMTNNVRAEHVPRSNHKVITLVEHTRVLSATRGMVHQRSHVPPLKALNLSRQW